MQPIAFYSFYDKKNDEKQRRSEGVSAKIEQHVRNERAPFGKYLNTFVYNRRI